MHHALRTASPRDRARRPLRPLRVAATVTVAVLALSGCAWMNLPSGQQLDIREAEQRFFYELYLHHIADASQAGSTDPTGMDEYATPAVVDADLAWIADLTAQGITVAEPPDVVEVIERGASGVILMCLDPDSAVFVDADGNEVSVMGLLPPATAVERVAGQASALSAHRVATDREAAIC